MSIKSHQFTQVFNRITGRNQWKVVPEDLDYHQEIARSAYADMLHDKDRNKKYEIAIEYSVKNFKSKFPQRPLIVLDIGTGTGLLSMMALRAGADHVYACEAFDPVAKCACAITKLNGFDKISIINKHSIELIVGIDLPSKANMLVAELLDTELMGEAALTSYKHAAENLLTDDAILIPNLAKLYCMVLDSPFLWSHNKLNPSLINKEHLNCHGLSSLFDLQASELVYQDDNNELDSSKPHFRSLVSKPIFLDLINFGPPSSLIILEESKVISNCVADEIGFANALLVWWEIQMEPTASTPSITMAPKWLLKNEQYSWRDHWMQAIYFPRKPIPLEKGESFFITYQHDALSIWLNVTKSNPNIDLSSKPSLPFCDCGVHNAFSRQRIAQINSLKYKNAVSSLLNHLNELLEKSDNKVNLFLISDCSMIPFSIESKISKKAIQSINSFFVIDQNPISAKLLMNSMKNTNLKIIVEDNFEALLNDQVFTETIGIFKNVIIAEPYISASILPWEHINFWYSFAKISSMKGIGSAELFHPNKLKIWAVAVEFENLYKIRHPVGVNCQGFDLTPFDLMIMESSRKADSNIELHPLWEYPGIACSAPLKVFEFDPSMHLQFESDSVPEYRVDEMAHSYQSDMVMKNSTNGLAFWAEWEGFDGDIYFSSGAPHEEIKYGENIIWDPIGQQQGVHIFYSEDLENIRKGPPSGSIININCSLEVAVGEFHFSIKT